MKKIKHLRAALIAALRIIVMVPSVPLRFRYLLRYLEGIGGTVIMPKKYIPLGMISAARGAERYTPWSGEYESMTVEHEDGHGYSYSNRTIDYYGSGFFSRPEAFYLVGCMTWHVRFCRDAVHVHGKDIYDWHPDENGEYHISPILPNKTWALPLLPLAIVMLKVLGKIFGNTYFIASNGKYGISNKLWEDMLHVGARPFTTIVDAKFTLSEFEASGYEFLRTHTNSCTHLIADDHEDDYYDDDDECQESNRTIVES